MKAAALSILIATVAHAQAPALPGGRIVAGGGAFQGQGYSITGAIAQHDAHAASSGGSYRLSGGFYAAYAVLQTSGAPHLTLTFEAGNARLTWPATATGWVLEWNSTLAPTGWQAVEPPPQVHDSFYLATVSAPRGFFRLRKR